MTLRKPIVNPTETKIVGILEHTNVPLSANDIATKVDRKPRTVSSLLKNLSTTEVIGVFLKSTDYRRKFYGSKDKYYQDYFKVTNYEPTIAFRRF